MISVKAQAKHLIGLLLHMKRWKFFWSITVLLSLISNHMLFPIIDGWLGTIGQTYVSLGSDEFSSQNLILTDTAKYSDQLKALQDILEYHSTSKSLLETCSSPTACASKMFNSLFGRVDTSKFTNFVIYDYNNSAKPHIECQMSYGGELNCPYLGSLAAMSNYPNKWPDYQYRQIKFFNLISRKEGKKANSARDNTSWCAKHENFEAVFSRTVMLQCVLIIATMSFYFLVTTQSCIAQLKRDGFLQLLFQKGLSVKAYWLAVSAITLAEVAIFATIYVVSLLVQCPRFFSPVSMSLVYFMSLFYMLSTAAVGILFSVTFGKYYFVGLMTVLTAIISMVLVLVNRMIISTIELVKFFLLFFYPLGHFAEFVQGVLLDEIRQDPISPYMICILFLTLVLAVSLVLAILLMDYTQSAGNGFRLPYNFFVIKDFWSMENTPPATPAADPLSKENPPESANIEPVSEDLRPIVRMSHLSKTYETKRLCAPPTSNTAVKEISALIYENHITAIIGHNGAGKTTLLNLLTGAENPTSGCASVCGIVVTNPMQRLRLRGQLGICPQTMNFASSLTVEQTLGLLAISCGLDWQECQPELTKMLTAGRLEKKRKFLTGHLSVGQQRQLAVIMALIGKPSMLFLDEPTSGLDPDARRRMWRLLQEHRLNRAILISTQFMDEADTLADRKIFLSGGSVICAGSSLFLKSAFDCGFVFEVTLKEEKHSKLLRKQICDEFKTVRVKSRFGKNLNFHLPAKDINFLPALAQAFEKRTSLISAFGLLQASLYDIFMRLKDLDPGAVEEMFSEDNAGTADLEQDTAMEKTEEDLHSQNTLLSLCVTRERKPLQPTLCRQLSAMVVISLMRLLRNRLRLACRVIVPSVLLIVLLATAFIERSNANHKMRIRTNMTNDGSKFKYGVCIYEFDPATDSFFSRVDARKCSWLYHGRDAHLSLSRNFLALNKPKDVALQEFLQNKAVLDEIESKCRSRNPDTQPCPITYTSDWTQTTENSKRVILFGTYDVYENFNSSASASASMGAYQRGTLFFATEALIREKNTDDKKFFFTAESIYDFRSSFVPSVGAFFLILIMSILPATFLDDLIEDKSTRVRSHLATMGMSSISYWLTNFIIHWLQYALVYSISVILLMAIVQIGYSSSLFMAGVFLPTLLCGLSSNLLMTYVLSTIVNQPNHLLTMMYFFFSILVAFSVLILQLNNVASIVVIAVLPPYAPVALTFYGVKTIFYALSFYGKESISEILDQRSGGSSLFFSQPHVMAAFVALFVHLTVLLIMLAVIEHRVILLQWFEMKLRLKSSVPSVAGTTVGITEDPGVLQEVQTIDDHPQSDANLLEVSHLSKTYPSGFKVIQDVSFATGPGEIFGILGPNGAGKTTTLSTIVGQITATKGRCEVRHQEEWLPSSLAAARGAVGYCPQYDPLYGCVTAMEHLEFYANVMGVHKDELRTLITDLADSLGLTIDRTSPIEHLSIGVRRRVSLAISLLSEPIVLVIDEATTGVDPEGKRFLWQAIRGATNLTCTVIVTTHSMEEVEAICNRVTIINRGLLVGLGTVQQLKTLYGKSYSLEILISTSIDEDEESVELKKGALVEAVTKKFPDAKIIEEFHDRIHFSIPIAAISRLSVALSWLVEHRKSHYIQYFSLHLMSMDQVFERMVKQHDHLLHRQASFFSDISDATELDQDEAKHNV